MGANGPPFVVVLGAVFARHYEFVSDWWVTWLTNNGWIVPERGGTHVLTPAALEHKDQIANAYISWIVDRDRFNDGPVPLAIF